MANLSGIFLIIQFLYAVLGMQLFGKVTQGDYLSNPTLTLTLALTRRGGGGAGQGRHRQLTVAGDRDRVTRVEELQDGRAQYLAEGEHPCGLRRGHLRGGRRLLRQHAHRRVTLTLAVVDDTSPNPNP